MKTPAALAFTTFTALSLSTVAAAQAPDLSINWIRGGPIAWSEWEFTAEGKRTVVAHHSVPVNFDQSREVTIAGVLTEITWINPHSRFRIDVTNPDGTKIEWLVEMGAANTMRRAGFPMERFMIGDKVAITGAPGRRERAVLLREVVMPDGSRLNPDMRERGATAQ